MNLMIDYKLSLVHQITNSIQMYFNAATAFTWLSYIWLQQDRMVDGEILYRG